jgi:hypothetical protein
VIVTLKNEYNFPTAPEHQTVVAIASVPTTDLATGADEVWPLVNEVIVPSLG